MPEDDDRPRDASSAAGSGWDNGEDLTVAWSTAVAPDDISELAGDVRAYHRERRMLRRREVVQRVYSHRGATPLTMTIAALALVAIVLTLLSLTAPKKAQAPSQQPYASGASNAVPNVMLTTGTKQVSTADLRPAYLALIPASCACKPLLEQVANGADAANVNFDVITPTNDAFSETLAGVLDDDRATIYTDGDQTLRSDLKSPKNDVTLVALSPSGTIYTSTNLKTTSPPVAAADVTSILTKMLAQSGVGG